MFKIRKKDKPEEIFFVIWVLKCDKGEPDIFQENFDTYRQAYEFIIDLKSFDNLLMAKMFVGKEVKYVC